MTAFGGGIVGCYAGVLRSEADMTITKIVPRYAETDQMGIIHHSVYAVWYEQARTEMLNQIGMPYDELERKGIVSPIVELNCRYKRPAYYNREVEIRTRIVKVTPVKCVIRYDLYDTEGNLINVGETTLGWLDLETRAIVSIQKALPEFYEKMLEMVESDQ